MKWWDQMPWSSFSECWALSQPFTLLFHFHQEALQLLFTFCHKGGVIYIAEVIDISPCNLDSCLWFIQLAFCMMYSAYKLSKRGDNIQPWCTPFPIWNLSVFPCPVLTVAFWPTYGFLRKQVRWFGIPISWRIFQSVVIYTVKVFGIINIVQKLFQDPLVNYVPLCFKVFLGYCLFIRERKAFFAISAYCTKAKGPT